MQHYKITNTHGHDRKIRLIFSSLNAETCKIMDMIALIFKYWFWSPQNSSFAFDRMNHTVNMERIILRVRKHFLARNYSNILHGANNRFYQLLINTKNIKTVIKINNYQIVIVNRCTVVIKNKRIKELQKDQFEKSNWLIKINMRILLVHLKQFFLTR